MDTLASRTAIVTGASRGLGRHAALTLAARGADVALVARDADALTAVARQVEQRGRRALVVPADLSEPDAPRQVVAQVEAGFDAVDLLVNDAGLEGLGSFASAEPEELQRIVQVNLTAALLLTRSVLPGMLARGRGHVVNVASLMGKAGIPYHVAYSTTKFGLVGMTQALRLEYAGTGVGFSVVCPGLVRDEGMFARLGSAGGRRAVLLMGTTTTAAVSDAILRVVRDDLPEALVTPRPLRPLLALGTLSPRFAERVVGMIGMTDLYRGAVERGPGPPATPVGTVRATRSGSSVR
jgi:short-subunit dehydrogenase